MKVKQLLHLLNQVDKEKELGATIDGDEVFLVEYINVVKDKNKDIYLNLITSNKVPNRYIAKEKY